MVSQVKRVISNLAQLLFHVEDNYYQALSRLGFVEGVECNLGQFPSHECFGERCILRKYCSESCDKYALVGHADEIPERCMNGCDKCVYLKGIDEISPSDVLRTPEEIRATGKANNLDIMEILRDVTNKFIFDGLEYKLAFVKTPNFLFAMTYAIFKVGKDYIIASCFGNGEVGAFSFIGKKYKKVITEICSEFINMAVIMNETDDSFDSPDCEIGLAPYDTPKYGITVEQLVQEYIAQLKDDKKRGKRARLRNK